MLELTTLERIDKTLLGREVTFHVVEIPGEFRAKSCEDTLIGRHVLLDGQLVRISGMRTIMDAWRPGKWVQPKKIEIAVEAERRHLARKSD